MPSYNKQNSISTYTIDKVLIQHVEDYLKQNVFEILHLETDIQPTYTFDFSVTLYDSQGIEKYSSIREHKFQYFRNDLKGITLELELYTENKNLKITIRFGDEEENSDIAISLTDDNAREKVSAIEHGLISILNHSKSLNWFFHPNSVISALLLLSCLFSGLFALSSDYSVKEKFFFGLAFWTSILYTLIIPNYFKKYSSFDTSKQKQLDKWFTVLVTGLVGFLLFSTLLTSVRKNLFGF